MDLWEGKAEPVTTDGKEGENELLVNLRLPTPEFKPISCDLWINVYGSDHCPVGADFQVADAYMNFKQKEIPSICTKLMPEFSGKQQKLSNFFFKQNPKENEPKENLDKNRLERSDSQGIQVQQQNRIYSSQTITTPNIQQAAEGLGETEAALKITSSHDANTNYPPKLSQQPSDNQDFEEDMDFIDYYLQSAPTAEELEREINTDSLPPPLKKTSSDKGVEQKKDLKRKASLQGNAVQKKQATLKDFFGKNVNEKENGQNSWTTKTRPNCYHGKPCNERTVTKSGINKGRKFFCCPLPIGPAADLNSQCKFFQWQ